MKRNQVRMILEDLIPRFIPTFRTVTLNQLIYIYSAEYYKRHGRYPFSEISNLIRNGFVEILEETQLLVKLNTQNFTKKEENQIQYSVSEYCRPINDYEVNLIWCVLRYVPQELWKTSVILNFSIDNEHIVLIDLEQNKHKIWWVDDMNHTSFKTVTRQLSFIKEKLKKLKEGIEKSDSSHRLEQERDQLLNSIYSYQHLFISDMDGEEEVKKACEYMEEWTQNRINVSGIIFNRKMSFVESDFQDESYFVRVD